MRTKLAAMLVTLAILVITYMLIFNLVSGQDRDAPKAQEGRLDLTGWHFQNNGVVPLDGEWELYPQRLLAFPVAEVGADPIRINVPSSSWAKAMPRMGMATYRLQVKVGDTSSVYGLKISSVLTSNRLFVNGEEVGRSGTVADRASAEAINLPYVSYFTLQPGWNEITLQAANFIFPAGSGISEPIYFGLASQISEVRDEALIHDWVTFTAFLIMGLYFIGLYSQRRNDYSLLAFGCICILSAIFMSTRGERLIYSVAGHLPYWLYLRVQLLAALGVGASFFLYVYTAFRPYCSKWLIRIGLAVGALISLLTLVFAPSIVTETFRQCITLYATLPLLYAMYVFVLSAIHRAAGSVYLIFAAFALNIFALVQNLSIYFGVPVYRVPPFEPFLFLLMLALLMSLRFSNAYRQIEELSVRLLKTDKLKDEFLARTSHEFKSPLHGILNITKSMLADSKQPPTAEQREKLELVTGVTGRLSQLVYDILDYSKLKQGELSVNPRPVDARTAVNMHVQMFAFLCRSRNIRLENRVPEGLPLVLADEGRFSQIVSNLLDNAVKHTDNGLITVSAAEREGYLDISVTDTGEGIDEQDLPHIFEAFRTFDTSMERRGFGLGLSIVKQLVELQRGSIAVKSAKGMGTQVTFSLPVADPGMEAESLIAAGAPVKELRPEYSLSTPYYIDQNGQHTVLVVDDESINLKVLLDVLEPLGYNVIAVNNGYEALNQVNKLHQVDLVILDLIMPGMSGFDVCKEIRKQYTVLELPVLMVTAAIQPQDKAAAFEAGANDFLPKPFDPLELKSRIGTLLALKHSLRQSVDMEVAFLRSQIKPHFLYNVLNSIISLSYTDAELSRRLTEYLADYLRGSFRFDLEEKLVLFAEEFDLIETYIKIEQARFKDRIRFECDIPQPLLDVLIPPLLIQPLVENAIRHGIGDREEGGTVTLAARETPGHYRFIVEDDGVGIEEDRAARLLEAAAGEQRGIGLLNINKRLQFEYGTELQVESEPGKGTRITVLIPKAAAMAQHDR